MMNTNEMNQASFSRRTLGAASRAWTVLAIVLAVLIVINVAVALLPAKIMKYDVTDGGKYSLSATTEQFLKTLDGDVTVYVVCQDGHLDRTPVLAPTDDELISAAWTEGMFEHYRQVCRSTMPLLLDAYAAHDSVTVKVIDPAKDNTPLSEKLDLTKLGDDSLVVMSENRYAVIDFSLLTYYTLEGIGILSEESYVSEIQQMAQYAPLYGIDISQYIVAPGFGLEMALTQSIEFVTASSVPHLYVLDGSRTTGDNVSILSTGLVTGIGGVSTVTVGDLTNTMEILTLDGETAVPDTAAPLMIYAPETDLSDETTEQVLTFIENGGNVLLVTAPENAAMPNLMRIAAAFGLSAVKGVLHEGNANNFVDTASTLKPMVNSDAFGVNSQLDPPLFPNAHGITAKASLPEGVNVIPLFTTSASTYTEDAAGNTSDVGQMTVGVVALDQNKGASLVWLSSADALDDSVIAKDTELTVMDFVAPIVIGLQSKTYTTKLDPITPTDMTETTMEIEPMNLWIVAAVLIAVIPLVLIAAGVGNRIRRHYR